MHVYLRDLTFEEAYNEIKSFFKGIKQKVYPSELSLALEIDYELVWNVLEKLEREGHIETLD